MDVGNYGSNVDKTVFTRSEFGQLYLNNEFDVPGPKPLPNAPALGDMPHVIIADKVFPLKPNIKCPYPHARSKRKLTHAMQIYNYRILAQCWRCFNRHIQPKTSTVVKIVIATCVLHNNLRLKRDQTNIQATVERLNPDRRDYLGPDGAIIDLETLNRYRSAKEAQIIRDTFRDYFVSPEGKLDWQNEQIS